ncbi:MAG TPA: c-type cytochrome biogenesis protein CcmI, partial [Accumulibacter sp.]|nr:c-type cytochrome biogenesis protein CcmI [Accumulibacter sp.]
MTVFIVVALLLLLAVIVILVRPLWRFRPSASADEARAANLAILRDQLAELERERQAGTLDAQGFAESYKELQRRLLDEVTVPGAANSTDASTTDSTAAAHPHGRRTAFTLILLLPLLALLGYALLGNPRALDPLQRQTRMSPSQIEAKVAGLEDKLRQNPSDSQGWLMLARSYKVLEKYPEAVKAYERASDLVNQDANLLADFAEAVSQAQGGGLQGKPGELIDRALKLDPDA